jgi:hypothetical protein
MKYNAFKAICSLLFAYCLLILLISCAPRSIDSTIEREYLFSLDIGPMEDQIALYSLEGDGGMRRAELTMRDGQIYISDSTGAKIARYNSYGDMLFMIYNNETGPEPAGLKEKTYDGVHVTRWAFTYPLLSPGKIAVDTRKHIYVEERLPGERHSFDADERVLLDSVILHFDEDGRFIEYLGQGGPGGGPFPRIAGLYTSENDEIAVVCRLPQGWNTYWYNSYGEQLFIIQVRNNSIPSPPDWPGYTASIETVIVAPDARKLFVKIDYYRDVFDESTNTRINTEPASSLVWILDVDKGNYESFTELPFYEYNFLEQGRRTQVRLLYSMLGLVRDGGIVLYFPVETGYAILGIESGSHRQRRGYINVDPTELSFHNFYLSPEGILSTLLMEDWRIKVAWWRMDRFLHGEQ